MSNLPDFAVMIKRLACLGTLSVLAGCGAKTNQHATPSAAPTIPPAASFASYFPGSTPEPWTDSDAILKSYMKYAVHPISLPADSRVDLLDTYIRDPSRPRALSIGRNGSVGIALGRSVLIVRPDGSRILLKMPRYKTLERCRLSFSEDDPQKAYFATIAIASDGTPFVGIYQIFSGAYSGTLEGVFWWDGGGWNIVLPSVRDIDTKNFDIGAADVPGRTLVNANFADSFGVDDGSQPPHYHDTSTVLVSGNRAANLGYGVPTDMRGSYATGFHDDDTYMGAHQGETTALEWIHGRRTELGPGIAYAVNKFGDAVGNDDQNVDRSQDMERHDHPTLWHRGRSIRLSGNPGSAFGIADNGTIVGGVAEGNSFVEYGFIIRGDDPSRRLVRIDRLLVNGAWHVSTVYGIAANGRLLAVGWKNDEANKPGELKVTALLLDPIPNGR